MILKSSTNKIFQNDQESASPLTENTEKTFTCNLQKTESVQGTATHVNRRMNECFLVFSEMMRH